MANTFLKTWLKKDRNESAPANVVVLRERTNSRVLVLSALKKALFDHFVGLEIIQSIGGFAKAANVIQNALPTDKKTRSGDCGEILATEYAEQYLGYTIPVRKLRYKDDREMAMRGDDVLGFLFTKKPVGILKTEAKSRINLSKGVVQEADAGLKRHNGRPNPSTLSFISRRLRENGKHDLAGLIEQLQKVDIPLKTVAHLIFTLSGNDPDDYLKSGAKSCHQDIDRLLAGCVIPDHAEFIASLFDAAAKAKAKGG
jgi:hypothetical protein